MKTLCREKKSFRHVAMVAKFLNDNKPKTSPNKLIRTVSFNMSNVGEILGGWNPKGSYLSLEKEKEHLCVVFTYSLQRAHEIRKFHVAAVQRRLRKRAAR